MFCERGEIVTSTRNIRSCSRNIGLSSMILNTNKRYQTLSHTFSLVLRGPKLTEIGQVGELHQRST